MVEGCGLVHFYICWYTAFIVPFHRSPHYHHSSSNEVDESWTKWYAIRSCNWAKLSLLATCTFLVQNYTTQIGTQLTLSPHLLFLFLCDEITCCSLLFRSNQQQTNLVYCLRTHKTSCLAAWTIWTRDQNKESLTYAWYPECILKIYMGKNSNQKKQDH